MNIMTIRVKIYRLKEVGIHASFLRWLKEAGIRASFLRRLKEASMDA